MPDPELQPLIPTLSQTPNNQPVPLLPSDRSYLSSIRHSSDFIACHIYKLHGDETWIWRLRLTLQHWLTSKWGHYFVILLVAADITCIFADFLVSLHMCEHGGDVGFDMKAWRNTSEVLDALSLVFSCLFMAELLGSVFAFGFRYFNDAFHIFDALVIITAFTIDVVLHAGTLEEAGSLVVVLRLWRVFKIIEKFSSGAEDQLSELQEKFNDLQREKEEVVKENEVLKDRLVTNGNIDGAMDGHADGHVGNGGSPD